MKILVVSEAVGEPNHKRGIFHFTRELIRSLATDGHRLTLLVGDHAPLSQIAAAAAAHAAVCRGFPRHQLLALYRFLDEADMSEPVASGTLRRTIEWFKQRIHACTS